MRLLMISADEEDATDTTVDHVVDLIGEQFRANVEHSLHRSGTAWIDRYFATVPDGPVAWIATEETILKYLNRPALG